MIQQKLAAAAAYMHADLPTPGLQHKQCTPLSVVHHDTDPVLYSQTRAAYSAPCSAVQAAGVHVKGFAPSLDVMQQYKVCLAPIRYGAGLKGKIVDSWQHGLPVCSTPVGAEGMFPATSYAPEGFPDTGVSLFWQHLALCLPVVTAVHYPLWGSKHVPSTRYAPEGISDTARSKACNLNCGQRATEQCADTCSGWLAAQQLASLIVIVLPAGETCC